MRGVLKLREREEGWELSIVESLSVGWSRLLTKEELAHLRSALLPADIAGLLNENETNRARLDAAREALSVVHVEWYDRMGYDGENERTAIDAVRKAQAALCEDEPPRKAPAAPPEPCTHFGTGRVLRGDYTGYFGDDPRAYDDVCATYFVKRCRLPLLAAR